VEFKDLRLVASRLRELNSDIEDRIDPGSLRRPLNPTEEVIRSTSRECRVLADELLAALKKAVPTWFLDEPMDGMVETVRVVRCRAFCPSSIPEPRSGWLFIGSSVDVNPCDSGPSHLGQS
jgi:hypothetical protein